MRTQVSFIFDDGFAKSCRRIAEIFEARNLQATFAVLANPVGFLDEHPKGDFKFWNELQARGHHINPHGYDHSDLSALSFPEATRKIDQCLQYFEDHLENFDPSLTTYPLTYNRSTPEIEDYLLERVRAIRTCGKKGLPTSGLNHVTDFQRRTFTSAWHGPDFCDTHLLDHLKKAESSDAPLFLYMLHGLDAEGWGPLRQEGLLNALDYIAESSSLFYAPLDQITASPTP
ncbi:polysaccharide deacetylase family protein [Roseibacillus persicicus]|uniref:polysaccharide deacetylase family protein n=1 Tax=Roseibacillus persicicus TaxID=454148 RepID=UPI00398A78A2